MGTDHQQKFMSAIALPMVLCLGATPVGAQEGQDRTKLGSVLEEVIVTAEKRAESTQDVPISILAVSGETLANKGIEEIDSLPRVVPNLTLQTKNGSFTNLGLRGITARESTANAAPIAVSQDGVPYANAFLSGLDFFDVERIEVLRGPQGTISGRNSTGGAINLYSKRPTEEFEGSLKATVGNYSRLAIEGYLSGPIATDRLLGRLAVRSDRADGWVTNTHLGVDVGDNDKLQARASLLAHLTDDFEALLILDVTRDGSKTLAVDDGRVRPDVPSLTDFFGVPAFDPKQRTVQQDILPLTNYDKDQATLNFAWDLGPSASLTATTGYVDYYSNITTDIDATLVEAFVWGPPKPPIQDISHVTQEITLTGDLNDRLDMLIGALYLREEHKESLALGLPHFGLPPGAIDVNTRNILTSWAGYTQWRYRLTDTIRLTTGVRFTHDTRDLTIRNFTLGTPDFADPSNSWTAWTPRFAVEYSLSNDLTFYASASRGYNSGGFAGTPIEPFGSEFLWNYEAGLKGNWFDRRLKTTLTGYYMDFTDLQIATADTQNPFSGRIFNAPSATIRGVELELDMLITDSVRIIASGSWNDATFDELRTHDPLFPELGEPLGGGVNVRDLAGNQLVRAPEWSFNISGEYNAPLSVPFSDTAFHGVLRASYAWQDKMFFDLFNHEGMTQDAYGLLDLSAAIETDDGAWQLSAIVKNLTDKHYLTFEQQFAFAPGVQSSLAFPGRPRTYGVSVERRF